MKKYYYYFINKNLRKIFILIFLRKLKKLFRISDDKPFVYIKEDIYEREKVFNQILGLNNIQNPSKKYKKLYFNQKSKLFENPHTFGGGADQELLYNLCQKKNIINILETGVASGWSTLSILLAIRKEKIKKLTSIDLQYPYKDSHKYIGLAIPDKLKNNNWNLVLGIDITILKKFRQKNKKFDLVHYDSDKNYFSKIKSFNIIWELLNNEGYLISDDVSDNNAFINFANSKRVKFYIYKFESKFIGIIQK